MAINMAGGSDGGGREDSIWRVRLRFQEIQQAEMCTLGPRGEARSVILHIISLPLGRILKGAQKASRA